MAKYPYPSDPLAEGPYGGPTKTKTLGTPAWEGVEYDPEGREDFAAADAALGLQRNPKNQQRAMALNILKQKSQGTDLRALQARSNASIRASGGVAGAPLRDPREELGDYLLPGVEQYHEAQLSYHDTEKDRRFVSFADLPPEFREYHKDLFKAMPVEGLDIPTYSKISPEARAYLEDAMRRYQEERDARAAEDPKVQEAILLSAEPRQ